MKWYLKAIHKVGSAIEDVGDAFEGAVDFVEDTADDLVDSTVDLVKEGKCYTTITKLKTNGSECYQLAKETTDLCATTQSRGDDMIKFGQDITDTLHGFSSTQMNVETLETIKDLMDGERLKESMTLCQEMDDIAVSCVEKSLRMMEIMEDTLDTVPDSVQKAITKMAGQDDQQAIQEKTKGMEVLGTLENDMDDVTKCIDELQHLNIASALQLGMKSYENLSTKAKVAASMFTTIQGFSTEVQGYARHIDDGLEVKDVWTLAKKCKDVWHCFQLSSFMKQLAEGAGKLIKIIIGLFKAMSDRLSTLWSALAFAKDCMVDCIQYVIEAKDLVLSARDKSNLLIEKTKSISHQVSNLDDFNKETIAAAKSLGEGNDITEAIELATTMDDIVLECTGKVVSMVERVSEGFHGLPDIITADIDIEKEGTNDDDPVPEDIEENVRDLENSREIIEREDIIKACKESYKSFQDVLDQEDNCRNMLDVCRGFSGDCHSTIDSFLGVWDLESAMIKISEMCRVVRLGEMIKDFANNIKRLLKAIIALMKSMIKKLSIENLTKLDMDDVVDNVKEALEEVTDKLKFWK